ncbi:putative toxin biosynthesis protein [Melanomma pulvis-pyrius CBS 109.77]|uniref:Putative toxin biosynthesis protein n=1 Tax=Melanomma pulvis-pyrius CBS 109.77 TaxID=1314802 RepID=A0A6A6XP74_9PLEO|nr:putative toxin biosynthesis protein [Melanomma pulvis-pyrius CBS 109.77]
MSSPNFVVTEHWSPCQLIREFPHGVKRDDAALQLAVKEYRPRHNQELDDDSITIIASHGNGFPKECYEALWDDLLNATNGFNIRAIWMADNAHQGASFARNKAVLGDDPSWLDHSRDLLLMVNHFRDSMKPPFVGLAHSMGCAQIANLSFIHPRLFHSLILIEPVIQDFAPPGPNAAMFSSMRREIWDSRAKAEAQISKNGFFSAMDPRVLKQFLAHALSDTGNGGVALTTPKAQEAWSYVRSNFHPLPEVTTTVEARNRERILNPDLVPFEEISTMVYTRPEGVPVLRGLAHLRPRTLFMYGDFSHINHEEIREIHLSRTGTGAGGNGGIADGGVEEKIVEDGGHLCVFEKPTAMAKDISEFLKKETVRWKKEKKFWATVDSGKSKDDKTALSDTWISGTKQGSNLQRPGVKGVAKL